MKFTKIIATVGPVSNSPSVIKKLSDVDVFRLNFSHGTYDWHSDAIKNIRKVSDAAILLDTKGPEVRTEPVDSPVKIKKGDIITLSPMHHDPSKLTIRQSYKKLSKYVKKGDMILIDDGNIELKVISSGKDIRAVSKSDTELGSRKSLVVPGADVKMSDLTRKDVKDINFGIKHDVDIIALSLVKSAKTVEKVKKLVEGKNISVIAKIEHPEGAKNIDEIIEVADGIMVARGDLGLYLPPEEVPLVQKKIVEKCNKAGKPVIIATQMLESMTKNPRPTRAEASDVANAILDGADCVMLSGETASGRFPYHAVEIMSKIIRRTDPYVKQKVRFSRSKSIPLAIAQSVCELAESLNVRAIVTPTTHGFTPTMISKFNPNIPILALVQNKKLAKRLSIVRGVTSYNHTVKSVLKQQVSTRKLHKDDLIILSYKNQVRNLTTTNCLEVRIIGEILNPKKYREDPTNLHHV